MLPLLAIMLARRRLAGVAEGWGVGAQPWVRFLGSSSQLGALGQDGRLGGGLEGLPGIVAHPGIALDRGIRAVRG